MKKNILLLIVLLSGCASTPNTAGFLYCSKNGFTCESKIKALAYNADKFDVLIKKWGTLDQMIADGKAIKSNGAILQHKIASQFGKPVKVDGEAWKLTDVNYIVTTNSEVRVCRAFMDDLLKLCPQNIWPTKTDGVPFICADFSMALWAEVNNSPYWGIMFGRAFIQGHLLNFVWLSDCDDIQLVDALRNDKIWTPEPEQYPFKMVL